MNITKVTSTTNTTACSKRTPKYLVIHYTAGTNSSAGHAKSIAQYFAKSTTKASADFIVDDGTIVQFNPDPTTRYTWAVGGSKYSSMSTSEGGKYYNICKNSNSISIEMCSSKRSTKTLNATDTDWYITDATLNNAIECAKYLMNLYNIPASNVIMHHHVTGKICPNPFCVNEAALANWRSFKAKLGATTTSTTTATTTTSTKPSIIYRAYAGGAWTSEFKDNAVCGIDGKSFKAFMIKLSNGAAIKYRAHLKGGAWLGWVTGYNGADSKNGYAGDGKTEIDAIEIKCDSYDIRYNVSTTSSSSYAGEVKDAVTSGSSSYAGIIGKPVDKMTIRIV